MLDKSAANRTFLIEDSPVMSRTRPHLVGLFSIVNHRAKKGRLQRLRIALQVTDQVASNELRCVLVNEHVPRYLTEYRHRNFLEQVSLRQNEYRDIQTTLADKPHKRINLAFGFLKRPFDDHTAEAGIAPDCSSAPQLS